MQHVLRGASSGRIASPIRTIQSRTCVDREGAHHHLYNACGRLDVSAYAL